jgi:hypothetical protein
MASHLATLAPAFRLVAKTAKHPDYFRLYPSLWEGPEATAGAVVLVVSEGGVTLRGRRATPEELARLGKQPALVLDVDRATLGRNGQRLILERSGSWVLGSNGSQWLEILLY